MKEVNICFNFGEWKQHDQYLARMALFSGTGKKYSLSWVTTFAERMAADMKKTVEECGCKDFPESLDKIIEAKKNDKPGN